MAKKVKIDRVAKSKIFEIESEIKSACKLGHFVAYNKMKDRDGVEIFLPGNVDSFQAQTITKYFQTKYGFQSCFFVKKHAINVFYEE